MNQSSSLDANSWAFCSHFWGGFRFSSHTGDPYHNLVFVMMQPYVVILEKMTKIELIYHICSQEPLSTMFDRIVIFNKICLYLFLHFFS